VEVLDCWQLKQFRLSSASREIGCTTLSDVRLADRALARTHTHTLALWLHWLVRTAMKWYPYTYAYTRTEQYCGVAYCPAEDVDIIRSTIAYFMDLTRTRERSPTFLQCVIFTDSRDLWNPLIMVIPWCVGDFVEISSAVIPNSFRQTTTVIPSYCLIVAYC